MKKNTEVKIILYGNQKIRIPLEVTLEKYGLSESEWINILESQGYMCPICKKIPSSGIFHVDHLHIKGWKKMPPEKRKQYIRGIVCQWCNRSYLAKGMTIEKANNIITYLTKFNNNR
jgi:hypothetical protein